MPSQIRRPALLCAAGLACLVSSAAADSFNFDNVTPGFYQSSLSVTDNGLTLTVTPEGNPSGFVDIAGSGVPLLGSLSAIGSNTNPLLVGEFTPLRFTFSSPVDAITFAFGDAGGDDDSPVTIQAFDALNNPLGTLTTDYPAGFADGKTLSGSFGDASYFLLSSGTTSGNANSIFWEVPSVTPSAVPEPTTFALLGCGTLFALGARRLRRRRVDRTPR